MNDFWEASLKGGPLDGQEAGFSEPGKNFDDPGRCHDIEIELGPLMLTGVDWKAFESQQEIKHFVYRQTKPQSHEFKYLRTVYLSEQDYIDRYGD